ncbi:histidine kinase dimerization/phosphoacceptor domain -containing protein [Lentiprolixibacter aurantiacus]|uniref:histidine kinase n=1 Tax=Lentiprolixibacter aurantiacus TaxID=2993939 RepID=A0AAE3SPJ3_9FLAO|nr:histidine kinase dimerization/phosphoacceptor domain -containing protein [Lentiprolixibacter aurantiacus]MCX2720286.1 tetratricopeptide repeat protein [Lentiprolixibacter aurantiacus]
MKNGALTTAFLIAHLLWVSIPVYAQIIDPGKNNPYNKVFVDTDNFGVSYLDSLELGLERVDSDQVKMVILNDLAYYWHTRNLNRSEELALSGIQMAEDLGDTLALGRFQSTLGAILLRMEKLDSALFVLKKARSRLGPEELPFLLTQMGYVYERQGALDDAADYAMEALKIAESNQDSYGIAVAYSDLSNLFWKQEKYEKGLDYGLRAIDLFEKSGLNNLDYDFTLYVVGNQYLALNQYQEARKNFDHAIAIGERYGFYNNLSDAYISMVELLALQNQYEEASMAAENAIKYAELLDNNFMLMRSWLSLGKLQYLQGKFLSAIESLENSIRIATPEFGDAFFLSQAYENLGKAYAGSHNYKEAYLAFEKYDALKNTVFNAQSDQRISQLEYQFDSAEKDSTILEQESKIQRQRATQTFIIVITAMLVVVLVLLYTTLQSNSRKKELLEQQNREKEYLLKEIHHRVKNNLEIVSSLLALQSAQLQDSKIADAMQKSEQRIHSMSMIHQKLYQGKSLSKIEMRDYFENLGNYIIHTFGKEGEVVLQCNMPALELDVDYAVPIGLIVNELLTNALKYAYPAGQKGLVQVALTQQGKQLFLKVSDDGIGKDITNMRGTGFGTQLIALLTDQLDGKMELSVERGTSVSFEFQLNQAA